MPKTEAQHYGERTDFVCSTLKTWKGFWTIRLDEYWGYVSYPGQDLMIDNIREYFGKTPVRLEKEAVEYWLSVYRRLADVRSDHTTNKGVMAEEGDEPWFSTGMGAIVIASASGMFDKIVLAGFDAMLSGNREGFKSILRKKGHPFPNHAWDIEHTMLPYIQMEHSIEICPI